MTLATAIGMIAAVCTTVALIPQSIQVIKTKNTRDISLGMYVIFTFGLLCWLIFGLMTTNIPVISANTISIIFSSIILGMKIKHR
jgi:MtN3 and saliva related transmembrane protein